MVRAFALAIGISVCILGAECLVIEKAVLASAESAVTPPVELNDQGMPQASKPVAAKSGDEVKPPDWAAWMLLSGGAVILLYSFTIPRRMGGG